MKRSAILTLAALALSATTAMAWSNHDIEGRYAMQEHGTTCAGTDAANVGAVYFHAGKFSGWYYNYADSLSVVRCKFGVSGTYNVGDDGHFQGHWSATAWDSPAACDSATYTGTWDGGLPADKSPILFIEAGASCAIFTGEFVK